MIYAIGCKNTYKNKKNKQRDRCSSPFGCKEIAKKTFNNSIKLLSQTSNLNLTNICYLISKKLINQTHKRKKDFHMTKRLTFSQAKPMVLADIKAGLTPALLGIPGIGKSEFLKGISGELGTKVFALAVNQLADRSDLTGARMVQDPKNPESYKQAFFPHATLKEAIEYAKENPKETPIIFLDEFNRTSADVTSACFTFITDRKVGTEFFPSNIRFVVAGNDSGNVASVDDASVTRLSVYRIAPDAQTFLNVQPNINKYVKDVIVKHPEALVGAPSDGFESVQTTQDDDDNNDVDEFNMSLYGEDDAQFLQATAPRTITYTAKWLDAMHVTGAMSQEEQDVLASMVNLVPMTGQNRTDASNDLLLDGLIAHAGDTEFTEHLYTAIKEHYTTFLNGGVTLSANTVQSPTLDTLKPESNVLNDIRNASSVQDIESFVATLHSQSEEKASELFVWLLTADASKTLNNQNLTNTLLQALATQLVNVHITTMQAIGRAASTTDYASASIETINNLSSSSPAAQKVRSLIQALANV